MFFQKNHIHLFKNFFAGHFNRNVHDFKSICAQLNNETDYVIYKFKENGSLRIKLNNPTKRNAFNLSMYHSIGKALKLASNNEQVKCVIFRGSNGFYSSGNDLSKFLNEFFVEH